MTTDNPASSEHTPISGSQQATSSAPQDLPRVSHPEAHSFRVVLAALVGIAVAAIAIAVVVAARNSGSSSPAKGVAWSSWAPDNSGITGEMEIANYLAPYYRLSPSQQMNTITPIALSQTTAAGTTTGTGLTIAMNTAATGKSETLAPLNGKTVAYTLCGLGAKQNCSISGTPTTARILLLRREALELALYTFRYISGAHNVIVVLPPGHATVSTGSSSSEAPVTAAVGFVRAQLVPWLQLPVSRTLTQIPPEVTQLGSWSKGDEAGLVGQVTAHALFSSQVQAQQVGGQLLVLTPLPAQ